MPEEKIKPVTNETVRDFLKQEYNALISLYIHYENGVSSIFNFYLTLLSTIAGATIVLFQLSGPIISSVLPAIGILIFLALTLGVVVQEAILNKNVDLAYITQAINLLKFEVLKDNPEIQKYVDYLHNPFINKKTAHLEKSLYARFESRFWFLKWIGSHQLFISLFNSLEMSFLVVVLVGILAPDAVSVWRISVVSLFVLFISLFSHALYANLEFQRRLRARKPRMSEHQEPPFLK